jgi:3-deoxy-D-arabino-heptulosonate 7-phosphate (DAHP) synthase
MSVMNGFYRVMETLKDELQADPNCNTITFGDISEVDLSKQTIFPLSHIILNGATSGENVMTFNVSILSMDIVDISKDEVTDIFVGNDNEQDVLNTQLSVLNKVIQKLRIGSLYAEKYQVVGDVGLEPFRDRFENQIAGWTATFDVMIANDVNVC